MSSKTNIYFRDTVNKICYIGLSSCWLYSKHRQRRHNNNYCYVIYFRWPDDVVRLSGGKLIPRPNDTSMMESCVYSLPMMFAAWQHSCNAEITLCTILSLLNLWMLKTETLQLHRGIMERRMLRSLLIQQRCAGAGNRGGDPLRHHANGDSRKCKLN